MITAAGHARPVAVADAGYGDNTTFRLELENRHWQYVLAVKGTTSAYPADARPVSRTRRGGLGRPVGPAYPGPAVNLRQLALAHADTIAPVTWRSAPGPPQATGRRPSAARDLAIGRLDDLGGFPDCLVPDSGLGVSEGSFGGVEPVSDLGPCRGPRPTLQRATGHIGPAPATAR